MEHNAVCKSGFNSRFHYVLGECCSYPSFSDVCVYFLCFSYPQTETLTDKWLFQIEIISTILSNENVDITQLTVTINQKSFGMELPALLSSNCNLLHVVFAIHTPSFHFGG